MVHMHRNGPGEEPGAEEVDGSDPRSGGHAARAARIVNSRASGAGGAASAGITVTAPTGSFHGRADGTAVPVPMIWSVWRS
jgi:hypothetical protein